MKCDKGRTGQITRAAYLIKLAKNNIRVTEHLLNNLLQDLQLNASEYPNDDTILVYKNLQEIIKIFQTCPATLSRDRNRSTQFTNSLERTPLVVDSLENFKRTDKLIQLAHFKILEKFKGFRECFRRLDKDFSGMLNFREFVQGMDEIGFHISLSDYRILFNQIDFDQAGEIDYFKFCLLDYDRVNDRERLLKDY